MKAENLIKESGSVADKKYPIAFLWGLKAKVSADLTQHQVCSPVQFSKNIDSIFSLLFWSPMHLFVAIRTFFVQFESYNWLKKTFFLPPSENCCRIQFTKEFCNNKATAPRRSGLLTWKYQFSYYHWSQATLSSVSTWMGDWWGCTEPTTWTTLRKMS